MTGLIEKLNTMAETRQLLQACDKLRNKVETTFDLAARLVLSGHQAIALRLGVDLKLINAIATKVDR
ncbi:hypothetical protein N7466_003890 [Penicillium verhagenii]|uniref:uncharacterized protein n=1 Tax=Penicillium verhagenii TaxID=1562060 RepID=UPI002545AC55|nr:uncharacterized protein N7466_003890 [Penicillium verhagenii]KAJ5934343.1 hypothetical protein N7466_003890 [Penicillium verhagenii]